MPESDGEVQGSIMNVRSSGFVVAVVDDDQSILRSLECLLESADYSVRLFTSATAMLESDCLQEIVCLISDVDMPGTDGFELARLVRSTRPKPSGHPHYRLSRSTDSLPALAGSKPHLFTKPFQGHELLEALNDALGTAPE